MPTRHDFGELDLIRDIVSEALGRGENWDDHVYQALAPYLDGDVVDAGANVGALTLRFARHARRVIAFEPNGNMVECLTKNIARLGLRNVVVIKRGIYSYETTISPEVTGYPASTWTWQSIANGTPAGPASWPDDGRRVSAIKVDCQGADLHVLMGLERFIKRDRPAIVFEFEKDFSELHSHTWLDYTRWLGERGYSCQQITEGHADFLCLPDGGSIAP